MNQEFFPKHQIKAGVTYHAITLLADETGQPRIYADTSWVGSDPNDERFELRGLSNIYPDKMAAIWEDLRQLYHVVNNTLDFLKWQISGGHALVSLEVLEKHMPKQLEPRRCVKEGFWDGFTSAELLPVTALQKAPTPKLRMKVLKRDLRRCLICGQRPADDPNIILHVHHIRPFGKGGVTTEKNLITLCHTCHAGLDPHYDFTLYSLIRDDRNDEDTSLNRELRKYIKGIMGYRKAIEPQINELRERAKRPAA